LSKTNSRAPQGEAGFEVFCGIDVAREMHHAVGLNGAGDRLVDRPLPNAEPDLIKLFTDLEVVPGLVEVEVAVPRLMPALR
jgi:hypothetical protein